MKVSSWQTTAAAWIGGIGAGLLAYAQVAKEAAIMGVNLGALGAAMAAVALAWGFKAARDDNVSSERKRVN